jgi:hypothetical protein
MTQSLREARDRQQMMRFTKGPYRLSPAADENDRRQRCATDAPYFSVAGAAIAMHQ